MFNVKVLTLTLIVVFLNLTRFVSLAPVGVDRSNSDNILQEQALLKSQYETFDKNRVIPLYSRERNGYNYERPETPFIPGSEGFDGNGFWGYEYVRPQNPFTYPTYRPETTTEYMFPPATARLVLLPK